LADAAFNHAAKVDARENAVVRNIMVHSCWLIVVIVSEAGSVGTAKVEWHPRVAIVDSVDLLSM